MKKIIFINNKNEVYKSSIHLQPVQKRKIATKFIYV